MAISKTISGEWIVEIAESFEDALSYAEQPPAGGWVSIHKSEKSDFGYDNVLTRNFAEAAKLAREGWQAGRDKMLTGLDAARFVQTSSIHRSEALEVAGAYPIVPAFVAGAPDCMVSYGLEGSRNNPIFRFIISLSCSAAVDAKTMISRGAAILSWIDKLEAEGTRCEIVCLVSAKGSGKHHSFSFYAKRADEPLDVDKMAFILIHPSMLRRIGFAWLEKHPELRETIGSGYGMPNDYLPAELMVPHTLYFGRMHGSESAWASPEAASQEVERVITEMVQSQDVQESEEEAA